MSKRVRTKTRSREKAASTGIAMDLPRKELNIPSKTRTKAKKS